MRCPNCEREYEPELVKDTVGYMNWQMGDLVQKAFPTALPYQREQLLTGICSDTCWAKWLS